MQCDTIIVLRTQFKVYRLLLAALKLHRFEITCGKNLIVYNL